MGTVLLDMAMSLDGFVSGPNGGDDGLHDWYFAPSGNANVVIDELLGTIGAMIIGRRILGDPPEGFDTPYKVPHFVLTHTARPTVENGGVPFIFVADGIASALTQAQAAAGENVVCVAGGAATAQQLLNAGLIDEVQIHMVSKLLGGGLRLFDHIAPLELERTRVLESPGVTHLRFLVVK
ncbi:MAG: dihydrofolate reductase [Chloroflexales bacterium]|nr:dihydrofolate reductase [Chloroflexales bacterium]